MNKQITDVSAETFAYIAPNRDCAAMAAQVISEISESVHIAISDQAQALGIARSIADNGISGIICSASAEQIIRAVVDVPIQPIQPSTADIVRLISKMMDDDQIIRIKRGSGFTLSIGVNETLPLREFEWIENFFGIHLIRVNQYFDKAKTPLNALIVNADDISDDDVKMQYCENVWYANPGAETLVWALKNLKSLVTERTKGASSGYRLRAAMQFMQEGIVVFNHHSEVEYVNHAAERILGEEFKNMVSGNGQNYAIPISDALNFGHTRTGQIEHPRYSHCWYRVAPMIIANERIGAMLTIFDTRLLPGKIDKTANIKKSGFTARYYFSDYLTENDQMKTVLDAAKRYAAADSPLLITGETGTGKEIIAQSVHNHSVRAIGPFVAVNFAALAESLLESELFGYEAGSFTGAKKEGKPGLFEQAEGGTIFLDEIGEVPLGMQARLLRVVQERVVMRVGGTRVIPINVRLIAATHRDLPDLIEKGLFRRDLYHRLNVLQLRLLPLAQRSCDLPLLIKRLNEKISSKAGRDQLVLSEDAMSLLAKYSWPGNVRELENLLERLLILKSGEIARAEDVSSALDMNNVNALANQWRPQGMTLEQIEVEAIRQALARYGNQEDAARSLGISTTTIWRKLKNCKMNE
ncbi:sigma-54 interaction domain-containing protein [Propionivibrio dicarboxylicus]|uniref:Transcriptional regulator containing PAS, AAA-type ATPase, and DNA-binding Fis domains n=1 Tax=Propionivibrio dicarboxylicus TaxID=83767 RepID=A0A1G7Z1W1_9RHOO|nr:sigma 54-interacting transcriptional regulator [Propionivibrio dicarboxylicus]SDH02634.1 Transcriptional regulator containing PAS, AAA-type ATPase, and DNA-binding Fis domains [Propionivibrio dicarboxylicus]